MYFFIYTSARMLHEAKSRNLKIFKDFLVPDVTNNYARCPKKDPL